MIEKGKNINPLLRLKHYGIILSAAWTLAICVLLGWSWHRAQNGAGQAARVSARAQIIKDVMYRRWNAAYGGVYAPITKWSLPNPYLTQVKEREIQTPSGRRLTLINPAYMTRQVHEIGLELEEVRGHITSLNPIRPENSPDPWEKKALMAFEKKQTAVSSVEIIDGGKYMRFMRPLITDQACLKCHAVQGYKVGDIRGGISVSVPMSPYLEIARAQMIQSGLGYGGIWLLGIISIYVGARRIGGQISDRKQAEEELRKSEERYRLIFEKSPLGIMHFDPDGIIVNCNENFANIIGLPREKLIGFNMLKSMPEGPARSAVADALQFGTGKFEGEYHTVTGDKDIVINATHKRITDGDGATIGAIGVFEDISEKSQLESKLRQAQKMEAVGVLAGGIAHDFNNLLQVINGYTQILLYDKKDNDPEYANLAAIQNAGGRAAELVRQLLLFSRKADTERRPISLNQEIKQARGLLERTIPKMISIEAIPGDRLWTISGDPIQIEQILLNLGGNAADAMPDGGRLTIKTENLVIDDLNTQSHLGMVPGRYVLLTISDTGRGMDKETVEHIFEPFYTTKDIGKGTGLGLASAFGIIKSHGGHITCSSEVGSGTTFKIYLPANEESTVASARDETTVSLTGGTETIMLVDDEEQIRDFASKALGRFGYTVLTASNGEEALNTFSSQSSKIDLVILDIGMPVMGGRQCLKELMEMDPTIKIIIASGYSIDGALKQQVKDGTVEYIEKPYNMTGLLKKVRNVFDA